MLEIRNLTAGYDGTPILHGIDLDFPAGAITVIVGPNGSGKSTLLKAMAGIIPAAGVVRLDGMDLSSLRPREMARRIAYLPQNRQVPEITVERLVLHGRFPYLGFPRRYRQCDVRFARQAIESMGILDLAERELKTLSGGQRQKAYIAMALAQDTPVVLMDEPTAFLDIAHQFQMMEEARLLADAGKTVVMVLHDLTLALKHADSLVVLHRGTVLTQDSPEAVFSEHSLEEAFGVRIDRTRTQEGWQYYYRERM